MSKNSNPALAVGFEKTTSDSTYMTVKGTVVKTLLLVAIVAIAFLYSWISLSNPTLNYKAMMVVSSIGALILGLLTSFIPRIAQFTAIFYAAFEGMLLGSFSRYFETIYPGIVFPAIMLTIFSVVATLLIYRRTPQIAQRISKGVFIAMLALALTYLLTFILGLFGVSLPIFEAGPIGIIFSIVVVAIAILNLIIDYDFILKSAQAGAPKYMEWYGAFGLMVTLIWLYIEILRLLAKFASNND